MPQVGPAWLLMLLTKLVPSLRPGQAEGPCLHPSTARPAHSDKLSPCESHVASEAPPPQALSLPPPPGCHCAPLTKRSKFRRSLKVAQQPRTPVTMTTAPATTKI